MVDNVILKSQECVKLLRVHDGALTFNMPVSETCRKARRQLSILGHVSMVSKKNDKLLLFQCFI